MAAPDVLELQDGSILALYNPRPWKISGTRNFGIRTRKSYDGGRTWINGRLVHEAGHKFENGCWEPAAVQMPDGEILLFFADEGAYRESSEQNISMLRSRDGGLTWTDAPEIVCFRPGARDGMPAPLHLGEGKVVLAIEDTGWFGKFKPAIIRIEPQSGSISAVGVFSPDRSPALADSIASEVYAGAPYLRRLSTGETLLSYQGTEGRRNNHMRSAEMKVAIGDPAARRFNRKSAPFPIPNNRFGLWNSLSVLDDDTVVALTSTNAFGFKTEVWMIKGRVIPELEAVPQAMKIDGRMTERAWSRPLPLFIGRDGQARLEAGFAYDDRFLYVFSRVSDEHIVTESSNPENNDGITVSVTTGIANAHSQGSSENNNIEDTEAESPLVSTRPMPGVHQFFLSADNRLVWKEGSRDHLWMQRGELALPGSTQGNDIRHASKKTETGYIQELAIPWSLLNGNPANGATVSLNVALTENSGRNVPDYRESVSGNDEDKPDTWLRVKLK